MSNNLRTAGLLAILFVIFSHHQTQAQPVDYSNCPVCDQTNIAQHTETVNNLQGIRGFNPWRPYTYGLIGDHKFSGTGYVISNPFFGLNWFPIRVEKQHLTGTFLEFGVSNYGDESDWNIHILPDPPFQDLITDALPYQKDNWYASGDWKTSPDGRFLIEAEITPDERRYGNPWFNNSRKHSSLINKRLTVYGPFVREEAHGNHPEIHPSEQIWWQEPGGQHIILLVIDDSNRFRYLSDFSSERVTITPAHAWTTEEGQRATLSYAFEVNPTSGGAYIAIQAIDDLNFYRGAEFADVSQGTKHMITYKGNTVLTVQESDATDQFLGIKFKNVCFNQAKGTLQGYVEIETAIGNGDGKEGFVALQVNKMDVGLNARPALFAGDLFNTWRNVGAYDDRIAFSEIYRGNMYGNGRVHGIIDFNGNGKSDLFAKWNGEWMVLYDGKGTWQAINTSSIDIDELRFGDISGDGKTDILRNGPDDKIVVSYGGTGPWTVLTDAPEQNKAWQLGDFDGNGRADILYTKFFVVGNAPNYQYRAHLYVKYNGTGSFKQINNDFHFTDAGDWSRNFRLGNFNGDNITDLFRYHQNKFRVYWGGRGDIKDLANVGASVRPEDLIFVHNFTIGGRTDVIHINPQTKQWTVFNSGQPGTLPLTIKHSDKNVVVFADLDTDLAQEPIAMEYVSETAGTPNFPAVRKVDIDPAIRANYVPGSLKKITSAGKTQLGYNQELHFYEGRSPYRSRMPMPMSINMVRDETTPADINIKSLTLANLEDSVFNKVAIVENITVPAGGEKSYTVSMAGLQPKKIYLPGYGITGTLNNYKAETQDNGSWEALKLYLATMAKNGKEVLLQKALPNPKKVRTVSFELSPFYSNREGDEISAIEIDEVAKELNDIAYGNDVNKRTNLFGNKNVFTFEWTHELKNMRTGKVVKMPLAIASIKDGKWSRNAFKYVFPPSPDLLQLTVKATVKDAFGHTQPKPLEFVFWNLQIETDGKQAPLDNWLSQFLGTKPGFVWVTDHWERERAGQAGKPQPMQITLNYLAEDKVLTVKELEQIVK